MHRGNQEDPNELYVDDDDLFREIDSLVLARPIERNDLALFSRLLWAPIGRR